MLEFFKDLLYSHFMFKLFWHRYYWEMKLPTGTVLMSKKCKGFPPLDANEIVSTQPMTRDPYNAQWATIELHERRISCSGLWLRGTREVRSRGRSVKSTSEVLRLRRRV